MRVIYWFTIYMLPGIIAVLRGHRSSVPIVVGNLMLGWTGIGWLVMFLISIDDSSAEQTTTAALKQPGQQTPSFHFSFRDSLGSLSLSSLLLLVFAVVLSDVFEVVTWLTLLVVVLSAITCTSLLQLIKHLIRVQKARGSSMQSADSSASMGERIFSADLEQLSDEVQSSLNLLLDSSRGQIFSMVERSVRQLVGLKQRHSSFVKTLESKLHPTELTFVRYLSSAEQVYRSMIGNLAMITTLMNSIETFDNAYVERRLKLLKRKSKPLPEEEQELETLNERTRISDEQRTKVKILLSRNEVALTKFAKLNAALAEMNVLKGQTPVKLANALKELESLAQRAALFEEEQIDWTASPQTI